MLVLVCAIGTLREFQAFSSNNGLVQDSCMLVLVCIIGTLIEFQAFSNNNGLVQNLWILVLCVTGTLVVFQDKD